MDFLGDPDIRGTIDPAADAAYIKISSSISAGEVAEDWLVDRPSGTIILSFDKNGHILGVEILGASVLLKPETLSRLTELE